MFAYWSTEKKQRDSLKIKRLCFALALLFLWHLHKLAKLGQCKAQPFKFGFIYFYFSDRRTPNTLVDIGKSRQPCSVISQYFLWTNCFPHTHLHRCIAKMHCTGPMNKFVCTLHGYIVYLPLNGRNIFQ